MGKRVEIDLPVSVGNQMDLTCNECGRVCLSKAGLKSHHRSHGFRAAVNSRLQETTTCNECGKVCKSPAGLKHHAKIHAIDVRNIVGIEIPESVGNRMVHTCNDCGRICLSKAGLMSHQRSHGFKAAEHIRLQDATTCNECGKVCKSIAGLKRHTKIHTNNPVVPVAS